MKEEPNVQDRSYDACPSVASELGGGGVGRSFGGKPTQLGEDATSIDEATVAMESLLRKINFTLSKRGRSVLRNFDLTPPQFVALSQVHHHPGLAMNELCRKVQLANPTVTGLVDRLEQKGLVERRRDKEDRRAIRLQTTELGETLFAESVRARQRRLADDVASFSEEEKNQLVDLLQRLVESMTKQR